MDYKFISKLRSELITLFVFAFFVRDRQLAVQMLEWLDPVESEFLENLLVFDE
jgi:hypothetical protein